MQDRSAYDGYLSITVPYSTRKTYPLCHLEWNYVTSMTILNYMIQSIPIFRLHDSEHIQCQNHRPHLISVWSSHMDLSNPLTARKEKGGCHCLKMGDITRFHTMCLDVEQPDHPFFTPSPLPHFCVTWTRLFLPKGSHPRLPILVSLWLWMGTQGANRSFFWMGTSWTGSWDCLINGTGTLPFWKRVGGRGVHVT